MFDKKDKKKTVEAAAVPDGNGGGFPMIAPEGVRMFCAGSGQVYAQGNGNFFWIRPDDVPDAVRHGFVRSE